MNNLFERPGFWRSTASLVALVALGCVIGAVRTLAGSSATPLSVSQIPLTVVIPAHPQIVIALGNSQSMDGDLTGAIYTGSGSLGGANGMTLLNNSSSPVNYQVPSDFTPPLNAGTGGYAPYTVSVGGTRYDNSASRLNVAKAGITAILQAYASNADFALMNYATSGVGEYTTWLYYMSPAGSTFSFQSTTNPASSANPTVVNPCYNYKTLSNTTAVYQDCLAFDAHYYSSCAAATTTCGLNSLPYMVIGATSDNALITDVFYGSGAAPLCLDYGTVSPSNPFTYNYGKANPLAAYVAGAVYVGYSKTIAACPSATGPTNAGYVPYSPEVMYLERGFGYYSNESANSGNLIVGMTTTGTTPSAASVANVVAKFAPYLAPETDNASSVEVKALAVQSPIAGLVKQSGTYLASGLPTSDGCAAKQYVVLVTDGLPTQDLSGGNWPPLGSTSATSYGLTATFNADGTFASSNDQALTDAINTIASLKSQGIKTYVIGLGAGVADLTGTSLAAQTLTAMAKAGGTGAYFPAVSASALVTDMQAILAAILGDVQSVGSVAVNSTGLNTKSVIFQSQFIPSNTYQDWTGDLFAYPINPNTGQVTVSASSPLWSAATQLDGIPYTQRLIATWDPVAGAGTPFEWNASASLTGISTATVLGQELETFTPDTSGADVLAYLRGNTAQEQRNGGQFRNRTHILGDIVNSSPVYVGASSGDSQDPTYRAFLATYGARAGTLFVGANDGMLHAFDATTGNERFAYIPHGVFPNLINLVNPYYGALHKFYVNGSPQAADAQFKSDGSWHTLVVSGEAQGGNTVFALDVTNPAAITNETQLASSVLWEFSEADMGLSYSSPAIASTPAGYVVFFGNGYNSPNQKPVLYAVDPQSGTMLAKIDLCAQQTGICNSALANGLSSVAVVNDGGALSGPADVVYAGDLQGNLWRVNISSTTPGSWTATVLFQARDALGNPQPITDPPAVTLNPRYPQLKGTMVFFGTGQLIGIPDLASTQTQSIYGVYDDGTGSPTPLTRSSLVKQTITQAAETIATVSGPQVIVTRFVNTTSPVTLPSNRGWFIDLNILVGERVITVPAVVPGGALVVTSYVPSSNLCTGGGESFVMLINYATGGSFTAPQFDITGAGFPLGTNDSVANQNPVGMMIGGYYSASPMIRSTGQGDMLYLNGAPQNCPQGSTCYVQPPQATALRGAGSSRTFWWEMR